MSNGNQTRASVEDRIAQFEARASAKSDSRDAEINELRETVAVILARQGNLESANARIEGALAARKEPGVLAIWGPLVGTAVALASLFVFVLNSSEKPIYAEIAQIKDEQTDSKKDRQKILDRQFEKNAEVADLAARVANLEKRQ